MEGAFRRQGDVHNLREVHLEDWQEELHRRCANVEILHRRNAHDGGRIHRILTMGNGRNMEHGIRLRQRVISGVVSKGAFHPQGFDRIHIPLDDKVGIVRNLEIIGLALHQFDGLFAQISSQQEFI